MPLNALTDMKVHSYIVLPGVKQVLGILGKWDSFQYILLLQTEFLPDGEIFPNTYLDHHIIFKVFKKKFIFSQ